MTSTNIHTHWKAELAEYFDSLNIPYQSPNDLDFYIHDHNLAIDLNVAYQYSEECVGRKYHYDKWKAYYDQGIQLIQIWDTDWKDTKDIWKSRFQYMAGIIEHRAYARKCLLWSITGQEARPFYEENHLQGFTGASVHVGLTYLGKLVSIMSFGQSRATKPGEIELLRFCTKRGYQVTGAASKLLKYYRINNPNMNILSFSDNMYSDGGIYRTLGFTEAYAIKPDYTYIKGMDRYHKQNYTKTAIQKKFNVSDEDIGTKTEAQWMAGFGFSKIWDAGKIKWVLPAS